MPTQIDVKVTKPHNKHGHGRTRKSPIRSIAYRFILLDKKTKVTVKNNFNIKNNT